MLSAREILFLQHKVAYLKDEAAYKKLFFHYHPMLVRFCQVIVNNKEEAEDLVSELLLKVWLMGKELNFVEDLTLYLYKAARNRAIDFLRKQGRIGLVTTINEYDEVLADTNSPEAYYLNMELGSYIEKVVAGLPPQCQLVYRLIKEQGYSYKQATEIMDISQNTLETHMRIALKRIRLALDGYLSKK